MKIAVCDDDAVCLEQISAIINEYITINLPKTQVSYYKSSAALLDDVARFGSYDIYILDIVMPIISGIELGVELRGLNNDSKILYLTSSREYAIDSYRARAFDYIMKPVTKERLFTAMDEAVGSIVNRKRKSLIVKTKDSNIKLTLDSILYAELSKRKVVYYMANNTVIEGNTIRGNFSEAIQDLLCDERFVLCGSGLAANLYHIIMVNSDTLIFKNGKELYIGKRAIRNVRSAWTEFWLNKENKL